MNILITGINGFIGKRVALSLIEKGYSVYGIDRGEAPFCEEIKYFCADITDQKVIEAIFNENAVDCVIHLAALVHKSGEDLSEAAYNKINCEASGHIFLAAANNGVSTILFSSTIEVYGEQEQRLVGVDTPCEPNSYYAKSKYFAEQKLFELKTSFNKYAVMRFAPVYAEDFRLNLNKRFYMGNTRIAFYFKDGSYSFHFCAADNIVRFIVGFIEGEVASGIYNVADEKPIVAREFLTQEKQVGRAKAVLRLPYGLAYAGIAVLEGISRLLSKSEPFFSRYNFRKLFRSTVYEVKE